MAKKTAQKTARKRRITPPEEMGRGRLDKYAALRLIHDVVQPRLYLEIGVQRGVSLALASGRAIGIDPRPLCGKLPGRFRIFLMTSDEFFRDHAQKVLDDQRPCLVFIDGMHLFEDVLADFINVEFWSRSETVVLVDDVLPAHPAQSERVRRTRKWTGDVWKLVPVLRELRPDLSLTLLDVAPTGMLLVTGLNTAGLPDCWRGLRTATATAKDTAVPPRSVLEREGVGNDPAAEILRALKGQGVS